MPSEQVGYVRDRPLPHRGGPDAGGKGEGRHVSPAVPVVPFSPLRFATDPFFSRCRRKSNFVRNRLIQRKGQSSLVAIALVQNGGVEIRPSLQEGLPVPCAVMPFYFVEDCVSLSSGVQILRMFQSKLRPVKRPVRTSSLVRKMSGYAKLSRKAGYYQEATCIVLLPIPVHFCLTAGGFWRLPLALRRLG